MKNGLLAVVVLFSSVSFGFEKLTPEDAKELTRLLEETRKECLAASGEARRQCWVGYNAMLNILKRDMAEDLKQIDAPKK